MCLVNVKKNVQGMLHMVTYYLDFQSHGLRLHVTVTVHLSLHDSDGCLQGPLL